MLLNSIIVNQKGPEVYHNSENFRAHPPAARAAAGQARVNADENRKFRQMGRGSAPDAV